MAKLVFRQVFVEFLLRFLGDYAIDSRKQRLPGLDRLFILRP